MVHSKYQSVQGSLFKFPFFVIVSVVISTCEATVIMRFAAKVILLSIILMSNSSSGSSVSQMGKSSFLQKMDEGEQTAMTASRIPVSSDGAENGSYQNGEWPDKLSLQQLKVKGKVLHATITY